MGSQIVGDNWVTEQQQTKWEKVPSWIAYMWGVCREILQLVSRHLFIQNLLTAYYVPKVLLSGTHKEWDRDWYMRVWEPPMDSSIFLPQERKRRPIGVLATQLWVQPKADWSWPLRPQPPEPHVSFPTPVTARPPRGRRPQATGCFSGLFL